MLLMLEGKKKEKGREAPFSLSYADQELAGSAEAFGERGDARHCPITPLADCSP